MQIDKLDILKVASKDLANIDYRNIFRLVNELGLVNMNSFKIPKGVFVFRIRPSERKEIFSCASQISYNPNPENYGRVNKPSSPIFYGSIAPPGAQNPLLKNALEILHGLSKTDFNKLKEKYIITEDSIELTTGKWMIEK